MNITKEFIPYEQSVLLKELGFDEPCFAYYKDGKITGVNKWDREDWGFHVITNKEVTSVTSEIVIAPTYSQAFRWFRGQYNVHMYPTKYDETKWWVNWATWTSKVFDTYEEAELDCLKKLIEIAQTH